MRTFLSRLASVTTVAVLTAGSATAVDFYPITGITSDTSATDLWPASNLTAGTGVGFDAAEPHNVLGVTGGDTAWVTDAPNGGAGDYFEPLPTPGPRLVFDLGAPVPLNEISVWGYSDGNGNGATDFDLRFSDSTTFSGDPVSITGITQPTLPRQSFDFPLVVARYVELVFTDNLFGVAPPGGDRVGLAEIAFEQPVIPDEPTVAVAPSLDLLLSAQIEVFDIPIANVGDAELTIASYTFTGPNAAAFNVPAGPASLDSLASDLFELEFNPAGLLGPIEATLIITSNDPTSPTMVTITGTVPPTEQDIVVPGPIDRGTVTGVDSFAVNVENAGGTELSITGTNITGPNANLFSVTTTPASVPVNGNADIIVELDPAGADGAISATLQIMSDDPDTPTAEVTLSATGLGGPELVLPAPLIDRGRSTGVRTLAFNLRNEGGFELAITSAAFSGADAAAFSVLTFPAIIPAQESAKIEVQIDTAGRSGPFSAMLDIVSTDEDSPTTTMEIAAFAITEADTFHPISGVTASTEATDLWPVSNLIQGPDIGHESTLPHNRLLDAAAGNWVTADPGGFPSDYIEAGGMPVLVFDLGEDRPLNEISVWGYSDSNSNGLSEFSLRFATAADGDSGFGNSVTYNPTFSSIDLGLLPNEDMLSRMSFTFTETAFARYVELTCIDNHFIAPGNTGTPGGDRVGIGEIAFANISGAGPQFAIFRVQRNSPTEVEFEFTSAAGATYAVDRSTDAASWDNELDDGVAGQQDSTIYTDDTVPAGATEIFYRVRRL